MTRILGRGANARSGRLRESPAQPCDGSPVTSQLISAIPDFLLTLIEGLIYHLTSCR